MKSEANTDEIICPSCLTPNASFASFCDSCGAPIGTTATLDPIQSINTQGFLFRKALEGRPKPIVLAGLWLIFFPALLCSLYAATSLVLNRTRFADFFFFWVFVGFAYVAFVILYRVTRNYLTARRETDSIHSSLGDE
ncbi:MAG TPA: hypothetical protein VN476_01850 [Pyrinomonadaceae bacterium]|nr:hypothetical protein [Pyrinomonadaceae bacterium]